MLVDGKLQLVCAAQGMKRKTRTDRSRENFNKTSLTKSSTVAAGIRDGVGPCGPTSHYSFNQYRTIQWTACLINTLDFY